MNLPEIRRANPLDISLLITTAALWAGAFVGIKVAVPTLGPIGVATARAVLGFVVLLPFALAKGLPLPDSRSQWLLLILMAQLNITVPFFGISWAELTVDAGVASLLMGIGPLFAMLGSHVFTSDDKMTAPRVAGVGLGFCGLVVLLGADTIDAAGHAALPAKMALIGSSLCYVIAGLFVRRIRIAPLAMAVYALGIASVTLVPLMLLIGAPNWPSSTGVVVAILYLGTFPTGLAYLLRFHLIRTVGYATFALSINLIPIFGVLLGVAILGEWPTWQTWVALALVMTGLLVARLPRSTR